MWSCRVALGHGPALRRAGMRYHTASLSAGPWTTKFGIMGENQIMNKLVWKKLRRIGHFGKRRDAIIASLNANFGAGNWELRWFSPTFDTGLGFVEACILFYEYSYIKWFKDRTEELRIISKNYGECIDNAVTNIDSGFDYTIQEASSTHIQDIALRNVLYQHGLKFCGPKDKLLIIRSSDSNGYKFGPGNIPFADPSIIEQPSLVPKWARTGSVEDFWQSNKYIVVKSAV